MREYIYGKNTVLEAVSGKKRVYKIFLAKNLKDHAIAKKAMQTKIEVAFVNNHELDQLVGKVNHQGVVASVEGYRYYSIEEICQSIPEGKQPLLLMLDGLEDPHNLGAILRSADAIGVEKK